ncbi:voltage-dependent calcium channel subunit alpha-2/delta-3 isoform X3 [Atheta coriaria]|uniref:voltage-dependent calcium channel subunit alpha-2/delta-3 isoform X3 n=1 Tax=Dalotia coriaria TaxID=877792 RepID=UPI0031F43AAA
MRLNPVVLFLVAVVIVNRVGSQDAHVKHPELPRLVRNWAEKLGGELWHFGELVTRRSTVVESYRHAIVTAKDGESLLREITSRVKNMMDKKVDAVRRIMEIAENVAATAQDDVGEDYDYYKAKDLIDTTAVTTTEEPQHQNDNTEFQDDDDDDDDESKNIENDPQTDALRRENRRYSSKMIDDYQNEEGDSDIDADADINANLNVNVDPSENEQLENANKDDLERPDEIEREEEGEEGVEQEPMASLKPPVDKRRLPLHPNPNFYNIPVNLNVSAVHVPSNVYDRSPEVIRDIKWSEELDKSFQDNYKQDPTISWQYFGSSSGFMRQYPAMIWKQEPVDLYDCRMRSWYVEAASSPKDIVILIDRSGSMTGMRREIAKHVVNNILDTLGNNDYVNIYTFSNTTDPLIDCFEGHLVQANLANVRQFKEAMFGFKTEQIANFSLALTAAFELLQSYREERAGEGAQCNQAIMLVTDGVYYNFKEIFKEYNWRNLPFMPVRVFTYLIGREVSDVREVKWMACANQGYYVHLSTYAEVREQVLQYLPVMARPMVLNPTLKPNPTWSPVYADVTDPKLTNWLWVTRERNKQRDRFLLYRRNRNRTSFFIDDVIDRKFMYQQRRMDFNKDKVPGEFQEYRLMTSVSLPVYDKRQNATRIANLLGVAGTDVPIATIERLLLPYRVGVNGFAFIVTNNGYILLHPDLRPVFQGILKPAYNRVDMVEVELFDDDTEPREFSSELLKLRSAIVNQSSGDKEYRVKYHMDEMNRIHFGKRHYYYTGIEGTPFTLVLALPDRYGHYEIDQQSKEDKHRIFVTHNNNLTQFFTGNWTVHPAWTYCRYLGEKRVQRNFSSPAAELLHFLEKMSMPGWKWNNSHSQECDRSLINRVLYDAKITEWFHKNITNTNKEDNGPIAMLMSLLPRHEFISRFGITVAFLATHSGLTRWQDFPQNAATPKVHFHELHAEAVNEVWYRRAVEQHYRQPRSFVYSVPFDADWPVSVAVLEGEEEQPPRPSDDVLVTASHAIFKEDPKDKRVKAVVGVVGFQMYHRALHALFQNITSQCGDERCKRTCSSEELHCMLVDDNGYIVVAYDRKRTGMFLGDFRPDILEMLVEEGVYNRTRMYDYQATCFPNIHTVSPASPRLLTPFENFGEIFSWLLTTIIYFAKVAVARPGDDFIATEQPSSAAAANVVLEEAEPEHEDEDQPSRTFEKDFDHRLLINKTHPEPCDTEMYLYHLIHYSESNISRSGYNRTMRDCARPFLVQPVVASNMVLLVINMLCPEVPMEEPILSPTPVDVWYNESRHCHILRYNKFPRRNYMSCINRSIHEQTIQLCGRAATDARPHNVLVSLVLLVALFFIAA